MSENSEEMPRDEKLRLSCLDRAIAHCKDSSIPVKPEVVVQYAQEFEKFVKGAASA